MQSFFPKELVFSTVTAKGLIYLIHYYSCYNLNIKYKETIIIITLEISFHSQMSTVILGK